MPKIVCIIKRPMGTECPMPSGITYLFRPEDRSLKPGTPEFLQAPHVADVDNDDDLAMFVAAKTAYRLFRDGAPVPVAKSDVDELKDAVQQAERQKLDAVAPDTRVVMELPNFAEMKKQQIIAWVKDKLPNVDVNPQMPTGAIIQAIREAAREPDKQAA